MKKHAFAGNRWKNQGARSVRQRLVSLAVEACRQKVTQHGGALLTSSRRFHLRWVDLVPTSLVVGLLEQLLEKISSKEVV